MDKDFFDFKVVGAFAVIGWLFFINGVNNRDTIKTNTTAFNNGYQFICGKHKIDSGNTVIDLNGNLTGPTIVGKDYNIKDCNLID